MLTEVRLLIVDDHDVVRQGMRGLLAPHPGWKIVGEASSGREAICLAQQLRPDIVILDITLPEINGFDVCRQIRKRHTEVEVLVVTMHDSERVFREALDAGARGYIVKTDAVRHLVSAVAALSMHTPFFPSAIAQLLFEEYLRADRQPKRGYTRRGKLTTREREIVQQVAEGKTNREIGSLLGISTRTVEKHRANVMEQLGLRSSSELVRYAIKNKLIRP